MRSTTLVRRIRGAVLPLAALIVAAGCSSSTEPSSRTVDLRRETWTQQRLTDYTYDYQLGSTFFINFSGRWIHIVVRGNAVVSATDVATGQAMPGPLSTWPTVDQLFDEARQAAQDGALAGIHNDPQYGDPTEIDLAGPPDASGSIYAKNLVPTP